MKAKAGQGGKLFGSITAKQVAEEIKKQYNINIDKRKVVLESDIKEFGSYKADVNFIRVLLQTLPLRYQRLNFIYDCKGGVTNGG